MTRVLLNCLSKAPWDHIFDKVDTTIKNIHKYVSYDCNAFLSTPKVLKLSFLIQSGIQQFLLILKTKYLNMVNFYSKIANQRKNYIT